MMDIVSKVIEGKIGIIDTMTKLKTRIMETIFFKTKVNWAKFIFEQIKEVISKIEAYTSAFKQKLTFGILMSHILAYKGITLKNMKQLQKS